MRKASSISQMARLCLYNLESMKPSNSACASLQIHNLYFQQRNIGGYPEHFGKPSQYTEGTAFLGTPKDHLDRVAKRPLSPDVLDITGLKPHYNFPIASISSITNRVTGAMLTGEVALFATVALFGDVGAFLNLIKSSSVAVIVSKWLVAFPLTYHFLGGLRHMYWDYSKIGNQEDKTSALEPKEVERQSWAIIYASIGISTILALYQSK